MSQRLPQHYSLANLAEYRSNYKDVSLTPLVKKVLQDRALLNQLCDCVYQIMLTDLQQQQNRSRNYGGL